MSECLVDRSRPRPSHPRTEMMTITKDELRLRLVDYLRAIGSQPESRGRKWICPLHADTRPSLVVDEKPGGPVWHCFPCGRGGDVFDLHRARCGGTFLDALRGVAETLGFEPPRPDRPHQPHQPVRRPQPVARYSENDLPPDFEDLHRRARIALYESPALQRRFADELRLSPDTIRRACFTSDALGFSPQPRYRDKDGNWKDTHPDRLLYLYPTGVKVRHPFGAEARCRFLWACGRPDKPWRAHLLERPEVRRVILVEGESDALAARDAGVEQLHSHSGEASAVVAVPGTSFDAAWAPLFVGKVVIIAFDADAPGQEATARVAALLRPYAKRVLTLQWKAVES